MVINSQKIQLQAKVTVYIPCHNYGQYLAQAVDSVLHQHYQDWELIIVDDGSADQTRALSQAYGKQFPQQIQVLRHHPARGLHACANLAINAARGDYIMRLDADDYLDESALLVLANYLDQHQDVSLVYPNYTYVDEQGQYVEIEYRKKIGKQAQLLNQPAHGACTMVRRRVLKSIGGYDEKYKAQDGHELWLKVINRYAVANVSTPLFYYRQHGSSLSRNEARILTARRAIERDLVARMQQRAAVKPRVVAFIPVKNTYEHLPNIALREFAGKVLLDYTLETALNSTLFDAVLVTTDDPAVIKHCVQYPGLLRHLRSDKLCSKQFNPAALLRDAVQQLEQTHDIYADILVELSVHSPLRRIETVQQAVDSLILYNSGSVLSVYEDYDQHFVHEDQGLRPLNKAMLYKLRLEREALFVNNGAIRVFWRDLIHADNFFGEKIGHVTMPREESFQIKSPLDAWLMDKILLYYKEHKEHKEHKEQEDAPGNNQPPRAKLPRQSEPRLLS